MDVLGRAGNEDCGGSLAPLDGSWEPVGRAATAVMKIIQIIIQIIKTMNSQGVKTRKGRRGGSGLRRESGKEPRE